MKKVNSYLALALVAALLFNSSCNKDKLKGNGPITLSFDNRNGSADFALNTNFTLPSGEQLNVSLYKYFVSNFELVKADGSTYKLPQDGNYFIIDESNAASQEITLTGIPAGEYKGIKFILGVDSLRSTMDIAQRTGALDPAGAAADLYWTWNSGYIFYRIDATSPASTEAGNLCFFHVGGYGGYSTPTTNNIRTISISSPTTIEIGEGRNPEAHIFADIQEAFKSPTTYSIATNGAAFHMSASATVMANNYVDMFTIDHVHNE